MTITYANYAPFNVWDSVLVRVIKRYGNKSLIEFVSGGEDCNTTKLVFSSNLHDIHTVTATN